MVHMSPRSLRRVKVLDRVRRWLSRGLPLLHPAKVKVLLLQADLTPIGSLNVTSVLGYTQCPNVSGSLVLVSHVDRWVTGSHSIETPP